MKKYRIKEIVCILCLFVFIVMLFVIQSGGTDKTAAELAQPLKSVMDMTDMTAVEQSEMLKTFNFDRDAIDNYVYYSNKNIMHVSEMLIVKLKDKADADQVEQAVRKRIDDQINTFKSYAPDQVALLEQSELTVSGNTVFYCVSENSAEVYKAFKKAM